MLGICEIHIPKFKAYKYEDKIPHINIMPSNHHNLLSVSFIYCFPLCNKNSFNI